METQWKWILTVIALMHVLLLALCTFPLLLVLAHHRPARMALDCIGSPACWFDCTVMGIAFHLGTAIWMDIPEMGLAFVACHAIWLDDEPTDRLLRSTRIRTRASVFR
ncbi:MAG: hypothetical protein IPJ85_18235 [Flavobacteriales bacterium]|nr:hypothetical protein [Flavobacteriales bacterium]